MSLFSSSRFLFRSRGLFLGGGRSSVVIQPLNDERKYSTILGGSGRRTPSKKLFSFSLSQTLLSSPTMNPLILNASFSSTSPIHQGSSSPSPTKEKKTKKTEKTKKKKKIQKTKDTSRRVMMVAVGIGASVFLLKSFFSAPTPPPTPPRPQSSPLTTTTKTNNNNAELLQLVPPEASVLCSKTAQVSFPLSSELKKLIKDMKFSVQNDQIALATGQPSAAGMAAVQWGFPHRIMLFSHEDNNTFQLCINPTYLPLHPHETSPESLSNNEQQEQRQQEMEGKGEGGFPVDWAWEGCFSVPGKAGHVRRYSRILAIYQTEEGEEVREVLEGWPGRVFQHETDHLDGFTYDRLGGEKCDDLLTL